MGEELKWRNVKMVIAIETAIERWRERERKRKEGKGKEERARLLPHKTLIPSFLEASEENVKLSFMPWQIFAAN